MVEMENKFQIKPFCCEKIAS